MRGMKLRTRQILILFASAVSLTGCFLMAYARARKPEYPLLVPGIVTAAIGMALLFAAQVGRNPVEPD
jgi:hypothetical protein